MFLSKHELRPRDDIEAEQKEVDTKLNNVFYQNNDGIAELVESDQDLLLNDDQEDEDMLFNNEAEDQIAMIPPTKQQYGANKRSPPAATLQNNSRKGANLSNISNTMHG